MVIILPRSMTNTKFKFLSRFNLPELQTAIPTSQSSQIISSLHAILKPFLLRRLKVDVEQNLPPKKEYVLYAPLSVRQREAYECVLDGGIREWLIRGGAGGVQIVKDDEVETAHDQGKNDVGEVKPDENMEVTEDEPHVRISKRLEKRGRKNYDVDGDDDEYFEMLEQGKLDTRGVIPVLTQEEEEAEEARIGRDHHLRTKGLSYTIYQVIDVASNQNDLHSETGEQHEIEKHNYATPEGLLAPLPFRLADRPRNAESGVG